jgi:hypothetical protein
MKVPFPKCGRHNCDLTKEIAKDGVSMFVCTLCREEADKRAREIYATYKKDVTCYKGRNPVTCAHCDAVGSPEAEKCPNCSQPFPKSA